jgi:predicted DNA-binding transcriptional regulator YafY
MIRDMRASRLVSLLLLLQVRGQLSAEELAARLEVSLRTVYRDVEALVDAGVPIVSERGPAGGYRLREGYRTKLTGLTPEEAETLFLAGVPGPAGELGLGSLVAAAQLKVLAAMPAELRERAERVGRLFHLDAPPWFRKREETPLLAELAGAVWDDRRVELTYRRRGETTSRAVEPLGLVLKAGAWYLVGRTPDETRIFRVSRIVALDVRDEHFERPAEFDLPAFWLERLRAFEEGLPHVDVSLRVRADALGKLRLHVEPAAKPMVPADGDGWLELTLPFERVEYAYDELLPLGSAVEVVEPVELRERIAETGRELAALYA